jgi:predicted pyridoxine 5'-phosphate oxidase superfamily flavin-nucleotide-binding protein
MSDPTNTDANTSDMDAQTTSDAGGAEAVYPDGSTPPIDPDTGLPVLEDRTADFPDEAAEAVEVTARPARRLGPYNGTAAPYGLMAKRAAKRRGVLVSAEPEAAEPVADGGYEPADHTVAEVQAYLEENPDQSGYVLDRERGGKARVTLIGA